MPAAEPRVVLSAIGRILDGTHIAEPDRLGTIVSDAVAEAGWRVAIYLVDVEQRTLRQLPDKPVALATEIDGGQAVEGTLAGRCFRASVPVLAHTADPHVWVPLVDGVDRLGVIRVHLPEGQHFADPVTAEQVRWVAYLIAHVLGSKSQFTDYFQVVRQTQHRSVPSELIWSTLPPLTVACEGVAIAGGLEPSYSLGGDVFDYAIDAGIAHVAIADATGHDLASSAVGAMVIAAYRTARRRTRELSEISEVIDSTLQQYGRGAYATGVFGQLDMRTGRFRYVNAGHPSPLLLRKGRIVKPLDGGHGSLLGLSYRDVTVAEEQLEQGDWLVLYTDGVPEARDHQRQFFGLDRLVDVIERCAADRRNAAETLRRVVHAVLDHQDQVLQDDASVVVVQWQTGLEQSLTAT